ncbi:MAG: hypothetical protein RL722_87 [Pseudomonadota bacterium]|jgi:hydroxyacylglutathione hydrolase
MKLAALPAFDDNYLWLLHDSRHALVVDPGDAGPVLAALQAQGLSLAAILVTHHHGDHVGGLAELRRHYPEVVVHAPARERMPVTVHPVGAGSAQQQVSLLGLDFQVIDVPGHTAGHIAYYCDDAGLEGEAGPSPLLFCGDTLFSAGCGRLFEGPPAQMSASLARLAALPGTTRVCCAHEYTLSNLRFALAVDPANADLQAYHAECQDLRARGIATLPARLARELAINPFLRCDQPGPRAAARARGLDEAQSQDSVAVFAALRQWKNEFR